MPTYAHPGVYVEEIPSGVRPIEGVGTSTAAFVGYATKGPVGIPVRIGTWAAYEERFGGIQRGDDPMGYSVDAYFANGGSVAYVVRLARGTTASKGRLLRPGADPASITASDVLFTFVAESGGTWGDDYRVQVTAKEATTLYRVLVQRAETVGTETRWVDVEEFDNVSFNESDPAYVVSVVGDASPILDVTTGQAQSMMVGESVSQVLSDIQDFRPLNGRGMRVSVNGTDRDIAFPGSGANAFKVDSTLADVADRLETLVRGSVTGDAAVQGFAATVTNGRLALRSGQAGASSAVVVTKASGATAENDGAAFLRLGVENEGTERTGQQVLHSLLAGTSTSGGTHTVTLSGGADGTEPQPEDYDAVFDRFLKVRDINTICLPGRAYDATGKAIVDKAIGHAERMQSRMVLVDPPANVVLETEKAVSDLGLPTSTYTALYYPWLRVANRYYHPETAPHEPRTVAVPPSGFAAGMWGRTDGRRGVWKAPAGTEAGLLGVAGLTATVEDLEQAVLNPSGVNCIRRLNGYGTVIWGARTLATRAVPEWRYVPVRRTAIYIERSLYDGMQWAVFEPNNHLLWASLRTNIGAFMDGMFRSGAFQGEKASDAYFVRCNLGDTMTQDDIDRGQVIVVVGFAPLKPAEFVIVRVQQKVNQR
jgi:uncharacterized protein